MKMRLSLLIGLILFVLPALGDESARSVRVSGSASVTALPDRATLSLGVEARNASLDAARRQVSRVSGDFLALCKKLGVADGQVQTTGLNLRPEYRWDGDSREQRFVGYLVQRQLVVALKDLDKLGALIEGAVDSGVNQVSPPALDSSRRKDLQREALALAAADARANAQVLADSLDSQLGPVRQIESQENYGGPIPLQGRAMAMESDSAAQTYQAGEMRFEARVNAVFDLGER